MELLHRESIYHRDIAPDNILIEAGNRPVLLDFGAARRVIGEKSQALTAILKPAYAPIEQYGETASVKQGAWTDLYALGATMHFYLLGQAPPPSTARAVQDEMQPLAERELPGCSKAFLKIIDWMLAPRPADRPQSVAALVEVLEGRAELPVSRGAAEACSVDPSATHAPAAARARAVPRRSGVDIPLDAAPAAAATGAADRHRPRMPPAPSVAPPAPRGGRHRVGRSLGRCRRARVGLLLAAAALVVLAAQPRCRRRPAPPVAAVPAPGAGSRSARPSRRRRRNGADVSCHGAAGRAEARPIATVPAPAPKAAEAPRPPAPAASARRPEAAGPAPEPEGARPWQAAAPAPQSRPRRAAAGEARPRARPHRPRPPPPRW